MSESKTTEQLLKQYLNCVKAVENSDRELQMNKTELLNTKNALGKHLVPKDAKHGEKFVIWVRDENDIEKLLVVEVSADTYVLSWRK